MEQLQLLLGQMDLLENKFKTTGAHLIEIVSEEGAAGRKAGFTNEQFIAMAATMENAGIGSDKVARSLRRLSLDMTAGSQATKAQKDAWKLMGQDAVKMAKMMQGDPMKALRLLKVGLEKLPKYEQLATLKALFSSIGASNIGNLLDSFDTLDDALKTVGNYQAAMAQLDKSFAIGMAGLWPKLKLLRNAVMSNVFAMADVWWPKIKKVTDGLTEWSKAMRADPSLRSARRRPSVRWRSPVLD